MNLTRISTVSNYIRSVAVTDNVGNSVSNAVSGRSNCDSAGFNPSAFLASRAANAESAAESTADTAIESTTESTTESKTDTSETSAKSISDMVKEQMEKIDSLFSSSSDSDGADTRLAGIRTKLLNGQTLTYAEQGYLAVRDPKAYEDFQKTESARRSFRASLYCCQTKDAVNSMRLSNALSALAAYKKAIKNGGDGASVIGLNAALEREISSFASSRSYQSLPTAAECNKFDRDLAKAKRYEQEKRLAERQAKLRKIKKPVKTPGDGKLTVSQVKNSPTGRKVLASRRRAAGCYYMSI